MFFHNFAKFEDGHWVDRCPDCGVPVVKFDDEYVTEYPLAATEAAQDLMRNHEC